MKKYIISLSLILMAGMALFAGKTRFFTIRGTEEFQKGKLSGLALDKLGRLALSPEIKEVFNHQDLLVYSMVQKGDQIFVGTGNSDILYQIDRKSGKAETLFKGNGLAVNALATLGEDLIFAESPSNILYRYDFSSKKAEKITVLDNETYIWKVISHNGKIYVATGDNARIYEIDLKGNKKELFSNSAENHFLTLTAKGSFLYFGGEGSGVVYELNLKTGKTRSLYDTYENEVNHIAVSDSGDLFFVTSSQTPKIPGSDFDYTDSLLIQDEKGRKKQEKDKPQPQKTPVIKNSLYMIRDGKVSKLFTRDNTVLYQVLPGKNGFVYVGGAGGMIYRYQIAENQLSVAASLKEEQILILMEEEDGLLAGTGNLGKVYRLSFSYAPQGQFESRVLDLGGEGKPGSLSWTGIFPDKTSLRFYVRGGNSDSVDESWSDWTGPYANPEGNVVALKSARYIQYRVEFLTSDYYQTPTLDSIVQPFLPKNRKPSISLFKVNPAGDKKAQSFLINVKWQAYDSDEDGLSFQLFFKEKNDSEWLPLTDKMYEDNFGLDSRVLPDGEYQLKLAVSDDLTNTPDEAEMTEEISQTFMIDNTAPALKILNTQKVGEFIRIEGVFADETSSVGRAYYSVNADKWLYFLPRDGIFDSSKEVFELSIPEKDLAKNGKENIIFIRVFDSKDNQSAFKIKINGKGKLIDAEKKVF